MTKDPVCGMEADEAKAVARSVYFGTTYSFCAKACKATFDKDPAKYVGKQARRPGVPHH